MLGQLENTLKLRPALKNFAVYVGKHTADSSDEKAACGVKADPM